MYYLNLGAITVLAGCVVFCVVAPFIRLFSWSWVAMLMISCGVIGQAAKQVLEGYTPSNASVILHIGFALNWSWQLYSRYLAEIKGVDEFLGCRLRSPGASTLKGG
jgi:hypothetical protein